MIVSFTIHTLIKTIINTQMSFFCNKIVFRCALMNKHLNHEIYSMTFLFNRIKQRYNLFMQNRESEKF